jgi:ribonuclease E
MLIDAAHPEETRVVVLRGNRVEEFDFESASRKQLRGNIYLAKVTRVEPSLQAAFVDYGGNRHGFLAFSEIHPDYYQIPVADRQALIEAEEAEIAEAEARERNGSHGGNRGRRQRPSAEARNESPAVSESAAPEEAATADGEQSAADQPDLEARSDDNVNGEQGQAFEGRHEEHDHGHEHHAHDAADEHHDHDHEDHDHHDDHGHDHDEHRADELTSEDGLSAAESADEDSASAESDATSPDAAVDDGDHVVSDDAVESVGAEDAMEEVPERRRPRVRQYKIQEVIKRRQVLLVQVVKEERGNKGAALTTYLSLAGRYSVLMPNTARGGGISRKITSITDRKRLKQVVSDLEVPTGMGVILRTAGASRTRAEVKRDFEYLLRLWENVRELTLKSSAPTLVYEEGSLIKRSIRDLYNKDIDEVVVAGDDAYREAKDFMRMLMPSHAKNVKPYRDPQPLFARSGIEAQLDAMFSPQVTLRSGGYLVINQTEALVSIDVNSGRSTREHNIEDTALQTNLEAAEEVSRQLRLRDLAGLIVIDFIDMEEKRNNRSVERKMKDALKNDRARIQVGRISHFGLLEMSRQRIRTGVLESTTTPCPTCQGTGHVRAPASVALHVLRSLEDQLLKGVTHNLTIRTRTVVALYILNQKRQHLAEIEHRFGLTITVAADETIANGAHFVIERGEPVEPREMSQALVTPASVAPDIEAEDEIADVELEVAEETEAEEEAVEAAGDGEERHEHQRNGEAGEGRRRRRRRGRGRGEGRGEGRNESRGEGRSEDRGEHREQAFDPNRERHPASAADTGQDALEADDDSEGNGDAQPMRANGNGEGHAGELGPDGLPRKRRRGRRGGRRGRRGRGGEDRAHNGAPNGGEHRGQRDDYRQPFATPAPYQPGNFGTLPGDLDEIDTTPRLDEPPVSDMPRRMEVPLDELGEIDTTPQPDKPRDSTPQQNDNAAAGSEDAAENAADPDRPKRSGWWQRRSFF